MEQQNNEKLTDKAFSRMLLSSVLCVILCLVCLCSTTYAWFLDSAQSPNNEIKTASECLLSVSVYKDGAEEAVIDTQNPITLECEGTYTVTLTLPKDSASGYCLITAGTKTYYTDYIARHDSDEAQTLTFTLIVEEMQSITFTPRWGIYSGENVVKNGGTLTIPYDETLNIS